MSAVKADVEVPAHLVGAGFPLIGELRKLTVTREGVCMSSLEFYRLREQPFGVSPDPAYLYPSRTHCEVLDSLTEAIRSDRGFVALIGEPGTGKTTLLHQLMVRLERTARALFLTQAQCSSREFFEYLMSELGVDSTNLGLVGMHNGLNEILFGEMLAGRRFVLIVDEAQNLDEAVLETIRMLSNYETPNYKLLQVILAGQPQLRKKLQREELAQLAQRITVMNQLEPLSGAETAAYVRHRLRVAGHPTGELFDRDALAVIAERSRGVPRDINKICYLALQEGHAAESQAISAEMVERAAGKLNFFGTAVVTAVQEVRTPVVTAKPRVVGMRRKRAAGGLVYTAHAAWQGAAVSVLALVALALPYQGARRMTARLRANVAAADAMAPNTGAVADSALGAVVAAGNSAPEGTTAISESPSTTAIRVSSLAADSRRAAGRDNVQAEIDAAAGWVPSGSLSRELGLGVRRIAIDAGHGGSDTGTKGPNGLMEKDLCLDVALRLGGLIEQGIPGAQVIYTRTDDRFVALEERTAIANESKADLFISIHANSSESPAIRGVETYYVSLAGSREEGETATRENASAGYSFHNLSELVSRITRNENVAESRQLAMEIQTALARRLQLVSHGERNRGVKRAPFIVLTGAQMPSVLSEISFVSNPSDERLLLGNEQRQRITEGLYRGIASYLAGLPNGASAQAPGAEERRMASTGIASAMGESGRAAFEAAGGHGTRP